MTLDGLEIIAVLVVAALFVKVLEQFGLFEPVGGEGNIISEPVFCPVRAARAYRRETHPAARLSGSGHLLLCCSLEGSLR